jgi:hypothetical protein
VGAACVLVALGGRWTRSRIVLLGVLFGAALLAKTTAVGIAPALAVALIEKRRDCGVRPLVAVGAIAGALVAPWLASNLALYGELITTREQLAMAAFPERTADLGFWSVSTLHAFVTFWTGDPFLALATSVPLAYIAAFVAALAIVGLVRAYRQEGFERSRSALVVLATAAAGAALVSATSPVLAAFNAPGRLAYVALGAVLALVAVGIGVELRSPRLRWGLIGLFGGLSLEGQAILAYPSSSAPSHVGNPAIVTRAPLSGHGSFSGVTVYALACANDTSKDTWLQITIVNNGQVAAEWSQRAEVDAVGRQIATSDYTRSTQLPVRIEPRRQYSGWLWLGPSDHLRQYASAKVVFRDIAADDYRSIGNIEVDTPLC